MLGPLLSHLRNGVPMGLSGGRLCSAGSWAHGWGRLVPPSFQGRPQPPVLTVA